MASRANACTPAALSAPIELSALRGARKPISVWPLCSLPTSSAVGGATLTTTSAAQASPMVAPASVYSESGSNARSPAPDCTTDRDPALHQRRDCLRDQRDPSLVGPRLGDHADRRLRFCHGVRIYFLYSLPR